MGANAVYSLSMPSDLSQLTTARSFVDGVGRCCGLEGRLVQALVLATGEVVSNIVRHAHRDRPGAKIHLSLEVQSDAVVLTFLDEGEPFDISHVPHYDPRELRIGGRGVYLIRTLMDDVCCRPRGDEAGNCLQLVKRLDGVAKRECG